jgi:GTP-binding protein
LLPSSLLDCKIMGVPQVVIVGRPNVGKSSLFNWVVGKRVAIVDDVAGVTRDRITRLIEEQGRFFEIVDTGGIGGNDVDDLTTEIDQQIQIAIDTADVLILVVDSRAGLTTLDEEVARRLHKVDKPVILAANKTDAPSLDNLANEFHKLGRGKLVRVSTKQDRNREELIDLIIERLPPPLNEDVAPPSDTMMKVAIVGRRNVGKSTFVNTLAKAERMIVSQVAGTTRDSVDVRFELDGKAFTAIDTPGLRRRKAVRTDIDYYSTHRAQRSIRRADVVLLFLDAEQPISNVDKQLAKYIQDEYRPCIFVVNKWDTMQGKINTEEWVDYLRENFKSMSHAPIAFITGMTGKNVKALLNHAQMLHKQSLSRIGTGDLNRLVRAALTRNPPPLFQHKKPKIYYATQLGVQPPTFLMICNSPRGFTKTYIRYLLGVFRDQLEFGEVPIKMFLQKRTRTDERDDISSPAKNDKSPAARREKRSATIPDRVKARKRPARPSRKDADLELPEE